MACLRAEEGDRLQAEEEVACPQAEEEAYPRAEEEGACPRAEGRPVSAPLPECPQSLGNSQGYREIPDLGGSGRPWRRSRPAGALVQGDRGIRPGRRW